MKAVRRNSKEFGKVEQIVKRYSGKPEAKKLIMLYALKSNQNLDKKILINKQKQNRDILYKMYYDSILEYLKDHDKKLFRNKGTALYFFKQAESSPWIELPFELKGKLRNQIFKKKVMAEAAAV